MIADTSCSPNVSTEEPASALKNPASRLERPTSLVASSLLQPGILSGSLCCCLLARHLSLTAASLKGEKCAQPDPKMCPPAIHPTQISTFSLPNCHLSSKVPSPSPISLSSYEPSSLEYPMSFAMEQEQLDSLLQMDGEWKVRIILSDFALRLMRRQSV